MSKLDVPIEERYLIIRGRVASEALQASQKGLPVNVKEDEGIVLFVGLSYGDIPIGSQFDVVFELDNPTNFAIIDCHLTGVTQDFAKPFDLIPEGWQTICCFNFGGAIPDHISNLKEINSWSQGTLEICICRKDVHSAILHKSTNPE